MSMRGTDCYVAWRPWTSKRWSKAHNQGVTPDGHLEPLCGAQVPADAEFGGYHAGDGICKRCRQIAALAERDPSPARGPSGRREERT